MALQIPKHIAIIMDGNGRWAKERNRPRIFGHREGAKRVDEIVTECRLIGVEFLTLYTFSTENWNRPKAEVDLLMRLLVKNLKTMDSKLIKNAISLSAQGTIERLPEFVRKELDRVELVTAVDKPKMRLSLALSYGGRQEILDGISKILNDVRAGRFLSPNGDKNTLNEQEFRKYLYHPHFPDPDLLIRTGGESRISNFLIWECAYSEILVRSEYWPDFRKRNLHDSIEEFNQRERRFGKTSEQLKEIEISETELEVSL